MMRAYQGKRVLITGGLGFIGSNLAIHLVRMGAEVTLVDAMTPGHGSNLFNIAEIKNKVRVSISDIRDLDKMASLINGQHYLFNLAGQVSHVASMRDPYADLEINVRGQIAVVEACRRQNRQIKIIHASSRHVYGRPAYLPVDEQHPISPVDVYSINKFAGESYHKLYHQVYGLDVCILRPGNVYGPRQNALDCVGVFMRRAAAKQPLIVFDEGTQERDYIYADDVCSALLLAGALPQTCGQIYNLGSSSRCSIYQLAALLGKIAGVPVENKSFPLERKLIEVGNFYSSYSKFQQATGWTPAISLDQGIQQTYEFFAANREHYCD